MPIKQLWAPWRLDFITQETKDSGCIFCRVQKEGNDRENLVLFRAKEVYVILNKYPYNNGHMMVVPNKHTNNLSELGPEELNAIWNYARIATETLKQACKPHGFNLGMNLGEAGGAGILEHLHLHIVPRWGGDTNFMPVLADTKSMPQHLAETYDLFFPYFRRL